MKLYDYHDYDQPNPKMNKAIIATENNKRGSISNITSSLQTSLSTTSDIQSAKDPNILTGGRDGNGNLKPKIPAKLLSNLIIINVILIKVLLT